MNVLLTGATGFLGWHTRVRLKALTEHKVTPVDRAQWSDLALLAKDADAIIHVAGVNRGTPSEVEMGNIQLAHDVAAAARATGTSTRIVFANSIQTGNDSPYGRGKARASALLATAAAELGSGFVDVRLPNLFGEEGRPDYNSFIATFVNCVINRAIPYIADRGVDVLHGQSAAQSLVDGLTTGQNQLNPAATASSVLEIYRKLQGFNELYAGTGDIPPLNSPLDIDLFNTLRYARFPNHYPISLLPKADHRGSLTEVVRVHGGQGQTFVSTTKPGVSRGDHFHLHKTERFAVISGSARISLRRLFTDQVIVFDVNGAEPVAIDMPTMWAHKIQNTGNEVLTTMFWTSQIFDHKTPDTYPESVETVWKSIHA